MKEQCKNEPTNEKPVIRNMKVTITAGGRALLGGGTQRTGRMVSR